jgi:hypothetical protein
LRASFAEGEKHAEEAAKAMQQAMSAELTGIRALRSVATELEPAAQAVDDFETKFRKAMDEGAKVSADADQAMRQSFTAIESGSRTLRAAMAELAPAADNAGRSLENAGNKADAAGKKAADSGNGFKLGAIGMTAMITGALALAPALAALPAIAGAVVAGGAAMTLGFGGVVKALKDYGQQSVSSGQSGAQLALTAFQNGIAIRNAEDAIAQAKKQSAQAAQTSADQIHSAQERVAASAYALQQAELKLQDAEKSETDAQKALTQARADAENQIKDLNNSAADSSIAVQQAELNLKEARDKLAQVTSNSLSTDDQKRQAAIDLASAQQGLIDAQQRQTEAQQAANAANKAGVDGMPGVVSAQNNVSKAIRGVSDAQHGLQDAQQAQADAQHALTEAVKAAADQQVASAQAIAKAEQNLADTYEQQKLSAAAAAASGSSSANAFAQDMAKLTPQAQAFVKQLLSMKSGADELARTAQTAMLPGLTTMLKDSAPLLPIFNGAVGAMGTVVGNAAVAFGNLMKSPAFQGQLTQILKDGAKFAQSFADGLVAMTSGLTSAASKAGLIVSGLGSGVKDLMSSGIPAFFSGLVQNAGGAGQALKGVFDLVSELLGPLGTVAGGLSAALAPALQVLSSPQVQQALASIGTSLAQILIALSPVITMLAQGLAGALRIAAPLLQSLAKFIQDNANWLVPLAKVVAIATIAFLGFNAALAANPIVLIVGLITGLVLSLIYAWEHFSGFRDFMKAMWKDIKIGFDVFLAFVKEWWPELLAPFTLGASMIIGHWNDIVSFVKLLPGRLASAAAHIWDWITQKWDTDVAGPISKGFDTFISAVTKLPGQLAKAGAGMWDWLWTEFKGVINTVIRGWDGLQFTMPSLDLGPLGSVGGWTIGVPQIPQLHATGGVLPGGITGVIGEHGWEPLRLPDGTTVIPHANAQSMAASGALSSGGGSGALQIEWVGGNAGDEFLTWLRKNIRIRGGSGTNSVQKVLGQAF